MGAWLLEQWNWQMSKARGQIYLLFPHFGVGCTVAIPDWREKRTTRFLSLKTEFIDTGINIFSSKYHYTLTLCCISSMQRAC